MNQQSSNPIARQASPAVLLLGGAVVVLLSLVIYLLIWRPRSTPPSSHAIKQGESITQEEVPNPPPPPKKIDPDSLAAVAKTGKTYETLLQGSVEAMITNRDWGINTNSYMQHVFECAYDRTIEKNDGDMIVELRHYKTVRQAVVTASVEDVKFDWGTPGALVLRWLDNTVPGAKTVLEYIQPYAKDFVRNQYQNKLDEVADVRGEVDSLSGKKVRIIFKNGIGVSRVEAIDGDLEPNESEFIFSTAILADHFLMPDHKIPVGSNWVVEGENLGGLLDPSLRGRPRGAITISRVEDTTIGKHEAAVLEIAQGRLLIDSTSARKYRVGKYTPRGRLVFDLEDGYVVEGNLQGSIEIDEVSRDHILFETRFQSRPEIQVKYSCTIR